MHARRYFKKALDGGDQSAALVIGAFKALYDIEQRIKDKPPDEKLAVRQEESAPIYDKIMAWCRLQTRRRPTQVGSRRGAPLHDQPRGSRCAASSNTARYRWTTEPSSACTSASR
jgi:hypothetical protein